MLEKQVGIDDLLDTFNDAIESHCYAILLLFIEKLLSLFTCSKLDRTGWLIRT